MYIIIPHQIDYAAAVSSIPEDETAPWESTKNYAKDDKVRVGFCIYTSLAGSNAGNDPTRTFSGLGAKWKKSGTTNRGAMFDEFVHTQSIAPEGTPMEVTVPWDRATGLALLNISGATTIIIRIKNADGQEVAAKVHDLLDGVDNWYDYFAYNFSHVRDVVDMNIGGFMSGTLTIILTGSRPAVGHLVVGDMHEPGATLQGVTAELINYSRIETNDFGVTEIVERASARRYDCKLILPLARADSVFALFDELRARPCVWIGDNLPTDKGGQAFLTAFGLYRKASLRDEGPRHCIYDMEITGVI
ncbi:hypothetical protein [uncultured Desulfovibrio sp.]|uniref:hypothetical protein n=1 Tax=uncultured Desulfovibrio sp. TaxID=167968 RepID=UPI0026204F35|nr:hypothetical protein [uncultured Desulfovibrio sp.]